MNVSVEPLLALPPAVDLSSGGETCRVRCLGAGPRLLLLHGGPGLDHHVMLPLALPLARHFEVWLADLPGHGAAVSEDAPLPGLRELYERMARWVRHLEGGVEFLGGHSLGAWVVRELLRRGGVRARAAVLLSPPAGTGGGQGHLPLLTGPGEPSEARRDFLEQLLEETGDSLSDEFLEAVELAHLRRPTAYGALLEELFKQLRKPPPHCRPGCPVLVLGGTLDAITPPAGLAAVASATEGARLRLLRDCGHLPWAHGDTEVAREIRRFLDELNRGDAG
ncbi:MAG TPA: alpha/beta hydrolase [Myxococcaceae bacterium]|nr:alpha/beta hydrolase [Myxococcaceae bacterium]